MIFIDTGAFLARYLAKDQYHLEAVNRWKKIQMSKQQCFTSNFVLNETLTLLARRAGYAFAADKAKTIYASSVLTILRTQAEEENEAVEWLRKYADQEVSFTDCISFVLMKKKNIKETFSFDNHFEKAGFKIYK